jgi:hypothetical protein
LKTFIFLTTSSSGSKLISGYDCLDQARNTGSSNLYNLTVNKTGGRLILATNVQATINITLTNGIVQTFVTQGTLFQLFLSNNAAGALGGGSSASCVIGNFRRSVVAGAATYSFPMGVMNTTPVKYRPVTYAQSNSGGASSITMREDTAGAGPVKTADWYVRIASNTGNPAGNITMPYNLGADFPVAIPECILSVIRGQASPSGNFNHVLETVAIPSGGNNGSITAALA